MLNILLNLAREEAQAVIKALANSDAELDLREKVLDAIDIALGKFRFRIGEQYLTQEGNLVTVLGRTTTVGYECVRCSDGIYRYDRSTHSEDAGRVTGTNHDYSCPKNFKR